MMSVVRAPGLKALLRRSRHHLRIQLSWRDRKHALRYKAIAIMLRDFEKGIFAGTYPKQLSTLPFMLLVDASVDTIGLRGSLYEIVRWYDSWYRDV